MSSREEGDENLCTTNSVWTLGLPTSTGWEDRFFKKLSSTDISGVNVDEGGDDDGSGGRTIVSKQNLREYKDCKMSHKIIIIIEIIRSCWSLDL